MSDDFYVAFEEKYRGSRELIRSRLSVYQSLVETLKSVYPNGQAVDLGCGRGEWLELLEEGGIDATGVDLDEEMVRACRGRHLKVQQSDLVDYLAGIEDDSICLVSGFHVAEHLPFDKLRLLVREAERVLLPGGFLLLETPNPENVLVGACSFYLDPTHIRPIPPDLLNFLPEYYGYQRTKVIRLQEEPLLHDNPSPDLMDVLSGVSPDYAVLAQTKGASSVVEMFDSIFHQTFGLTLTDLSTAYQKSVEARFGHLEVKADHVDRLENKILKLENDLEENQKIFFCLQAKIDDRHRELQAVYHSRSWRLTQPLRSLSHRWKIICHFGIKTKEKSKKLLKLVVTSVFLGVNKSKLLKRSLQPLLNRSPWLKSGLKRCVTPLSNDLFGSRVWFSRQSSSHLVSQVAQSPALAASLKAGKLSVDDVLHRIRAETRGISEQSRDVF